MPAGNVRPLASQAPRLGAAAKAEYQRRGWRITAHGNIDTGQVVGPCSVCSTPTVLYGPRGRPTCSDCETAR